MPPVPLRPRRRPRLPARDSLRRAAHSRTALVLGVVAAVTVPLLTLPSLPRVALWPVLVGLVPWVVGKYVLCPLRWHALTDARLGRWWHLRAYAESELVGLLTPGHVGADLWRLKRLTGSGLDRSAAVVSVTADRMVGALGLALFVGFAGTTLPLDLLIPAAGLGAAALLGLLVVRRLRPDWLPGRPALPAPRRLVQGLALSAGYQLSIAALLLGTLAATGHVLDPLTVLGAFGASQVAGALPGPHGASPRDAALVVALVALGIPLLAAAAAVAMKAAVAWLPALLLGGSSLFRTRREHRAALA
ncbi:lysylphosphatidylglycerol synthase domain-containing protein [Nocardioides solisilvae]|uniref:lysylphosphatidylglycerol synthase domain-containing protein n=1 Tax=Nocardioides solisilvae TaxID=1542435 RepID=UPI0013A58356|nr:lysylphosphatidylglycerol synthase domain-containing protein [Nocardioides solisilvae]